MKISDIHRDCKVIADKHGLTVLQISVSFKQHYVKYVGTEAPLYLEITCYYQPIDNEDYGNFTVSVGPDSDKDFTYDVALHEFETNCVKSAVLKTSDELLNVETDSI